MQGFPHGQTGSDRLIDIDQVRPLSGVSSRSTIYKWIKQGRFPAPAVRLGPRFTRWRCRDISDWLADPEAWIARQRAGGVSLSAAVDYVNALAGEGAA